MADGNQRARLASFIEPLRVEPGVRVDVTADFDPRWHADVVTKEDGSELLARGVKLMAEYQARLAAQDTRGLLVCLQGLDTAGKDGAIRHVMSGFNPQGVHVTSFKVPSAEELDHDFLWRYQKALPRRGEIGVFNRSHYEEVLVVRVHPELLERQRLPASGRGAAVWEHRFRAINDWERYLVENGIAIVKIFLNLSKEEQRLRLLRRIEQPDRRWKFSEQDVNEREHWDDYQSAISEMLSHTSTAWAPWYVVPADRKWFARICVSAILAHELMTMDPRYPRLSADAEASLAAAKARLDAQAPVA